MRTPASGGYRAPSESTPHLVAAQPAPYPSLVTIGVDQATHTTWLLDLETIGDLTIAGDPHRVDDLQRYLAAELAVSPWAHGIQVLLVDPALHAIAALQPERLLATDAERATQRASAALDGAPLGAALLAARRDRHADGTSPLVIITSDHLDVEPLESGRGDRRQRISHVRPADTNATLTLHGDHLTLQPEGITLTALLLTKAQADTLTGVSQGLADAADAPVPDLAGAGALDASRSSRRDPADLAGRARTRHPRLLAPAQARRRLPCRRSDYRRRPRQPRAPHPHGHCRQRSKPSTRPSMATWPTGTTRSVNAPRSRSSAPSPSPATARTRTRSTASPAPLSSSSTSPAASEASPPTARPRTSAGASAPPGTAPSTPAATSANDQTAPNGSPKRPSHPPRAPAVSPPTSCTPMYSYRPTSSVGYAFGDKREEVVPESMTSQPP